jgi:DNA-binding GntR family transcriptional regulator
MPPSKPAPRPQPRTPSTSRVAALARELATDILDGKRPVGATLPTDAELAAQHGLPLAAARGAVRQLEILGLIARSRGNAARVVSSEVRASYVVLRDGEDDGNGYAGETRLAIDRQRQVTADAELAVLLGVNEGTQWLHLTGLRQPFDPGYGPLSWTDIWLATDAIAVPGDLGFGRVDIEALTRGSVATVQEDVSAGLLTPAQARMLRARGGTAALYLLRRYLRSGGAVVGAVRDVHPADRITLSVRGRPGA